MSSIAIPSRRGFMLGAGAMLAAPAIVRVASLMPVSVAGLDAPCPTGYTMTVRRLGPIPTPDDMEWMARIIRDSASIWTPIGRTRDGRYIAA